jgi:transcriptional regulator with XRE-family HTH domain
MDDFSLSPERIARLKRAEKLARKINLLLDAIMSDSGDPFDYPEIRDRAKEIGYDITRTRWSLLKNAKEQVVPVEALHAIAAVFDVPARYLVRDDARVPRQVEVKLEEVRKKRRADVRHYATRVLEPVDPEALKAILEILGDEI